MRYKYNVDSTKNCLDVNCEQPQECIVNIKQNEIDLYHYRFFHCLLLKLLFIRRHLDIFLIKIPCQNQIQAILKSLYSTINIIL